MSRYDDPIPVHGQVFSGIDVRSIEQVSLLQDILEDGMRKYAGKDGEQKLAKWYNELERIREQSVKEKWTGW